MLDKEFVTRKVKLIQEELSKLEVLKGFSFDEVAKDGIKMAAVERYLEKVVMRAIDINQHIISEMGKGNEPLRGYEDTFYALAKSVFTGRILLKKLLPVQD